MSKKVVDKKVIHKKFVDKKVIHKKFVDKKVVDESQSSINKYLIKDDLTDNDRYEIVNIIDKIMEYDGPILRNIVYEISTYSMTISDNKKNIVKIIIYTIFCKKNFEGDHKKYLYMFTQILEHPHLKEYFTDILDIIFDSSEYIKYSFDDMCTCGIICKLYNFGFDYDILKYKNKDNIK